MECLFEKKKKLKIKRGKKKNNKFFLTFQLAWVTLLVEKQKYLFAEKPNLTSLIALQWKRMSE